MRRPRTRLAYCTGIRRCPSLTHTTPAITTMAMITNGMIRRMPSGPVMMGAAWCGMRPTMPAKMMKLIPFPRPRSLISSPSHISRIVPAVNERSRLRVWKLKKLEAGRTPAFWSRTVKP